jgi:hypothetical protein
MQHPLIKYTLTTFSYGFYRSITSESKPDELFCNKITDSVFNGIMYMNPILLPINLINLVERIEIKTFNKDPQKYKESYREWLNRYNYNTL